LQIGKTGSGVPWTVKAIKRKDFGDKFVWASQFIKDFVADYMQVDGASLLDFGCGAGEMALGLALQNYPARVVGVDISTDFDRLAELALENLDLRALPENLQFQKVRPGDVGTHTSKYDLIYSWSVFHHVDQKVLPSVIKGLRQILSRNGYLVLQISPLFYSAYGSVLSSVIKEPWAHLVYQHDNFESLFFNEANLPDFCSDVAVAQAWKPGAWDTYRTLNRITVPEILDEFERAGFKLVKKHTTTNFEDIPAKLKDIYIEEILRTEQAILLFQIQP